MKLHTYRPYVTDLQILQYSIMHMMEYDWESGHHRLELAEDLRAQKAGRQELTEAAEFILVSFIWPSVCRPLLKILH